MPSAEFGDTEGVGAIIIVEQIVGRRARVLRPTASPAAVAALSNALGHDPARRNGGNSRIARVAG